MTLTPWKGRNQIVHPELTPDIKNPNFFCCACDKTFVTKQKYHVHLRNIHKMKFAAPISTIKNPNETPDVNNPKHYCAHKGGEITTS
jgi:hypothetical protein